MDPEKVVRSSVEHYIGTDKDVESSMQQWRDDFRTLDRDCNGLLDRNDAKAGKLPLQIFQAILQRACVCDPNEASISFQEYLLLKIASSNFASASSASQVLLELRATKVFNDALAGRRSGKLKLEDIRAALQSAGYDVSDAALDDAMLECDSKRCGALDLQQFTHLMSILSLGVQPLATPTAAGAGDHEGSPRKDDGGNRMTNSMRRRDQLRKQMVEQDKR